MNRPDDRPGGSLLTLLTALVLIILPGGVWAQDLVTDRPDQTESAEVVQPGRVQFESGWTFVRDNHADTSVRHHQFPSTVLRIGIAPRLELRVGMDGWNWRRESGLSRSGFGDLNLGAKLLLWKERGPRPQVALLGSAVIPSGESGFSREKVDPEIRAALAHTLSERLSLGYNIDVARVSEQGEDGDAVSGTEFLYTATLGLGIGPRSGVFAEFFGSLPLSQSGEAAHAFDAGFTLLLAANVQLDISGGFAISAASEDWFVGGGLSVRLPR